MAISPPLAGCRPASILPSAWSSATTAVRLRRRLPTIWSTRDRAGWTAIQIRFTPPLRSQQLNIPSARCAKWTLTPQRLPSLSLRARLTISVPKTTREHSTPHPISSSTKVSSSDATQGSLVKSTKTNRLNNTSVPGETRTRRVVLIAGPGTEILDLVGPLQVFTRAADMFGRQNPGALPIYAVEVVATTLRTAIMTNCGLRITAHKTFREVRGEIDTLLVAGGAAIEKDEIPMEVV